MPGAGVEPARSFGPEDQIRLDFSSSNVPRFDVNPNIGGPLGERGALLVTQNTIYYDADHPSHIVLPIV